MKRKEAERMTNKQTSALLEAIKIIAEAETDKRQFMNALNRIQKEVKENAAPDATGSGKAN